MIPNTSSMATVQGDLDAEEDIAMTIDAAATAHIMSVLTNLYSDQELACIREYSTNALDSHIEAGQTRPIEVTLPSLLSPYFKVRDFGVGMNMDDLRDTYSKYGASTKRDSNDFNGTLGLGSKSALTYTHQFLVTSIKDGVKYHIAVSRVDDGTAVMRVIDTVATDEHNGVEISIPTQRGSTFEAKARRFFMFWKPGTVLLNEEDPCVELKEITDGIYTYEAPNIYGNKDYIVMANVPYPVNIKLDGDLHEYSRKFGIVAFVETGAIHFTPSREELMYTDATKSVIEDIQTRYRKSIIDTISAEINAAPTTGEAYKVYKSWCDSVGAQFIANASIKYRNQTIPTGMIRSAGGDFATGTVWNKSAYRYAVDTRTNLAYDRMFNSLVIINYTSSTGVSATHKQKIKEYMRLNDVSNSYVVLLLGSDIPGSPWTDAVEAVEWKTISAIKLSDTVRSGGGKSYAGGYDIWGTDGLKIRHDLKPTDNVVYYSNSDYKADRYGTNQINMTSYQCLTSLMPDVRLVQVSKNRLEKLLRLFPKAKELRAAIQDAVTPVVNALSWEDRVRLTSYRYGTSRWSKHYDLADRIDDPDISKWMTAFSKPQSDQEKKFLSLAEVSRQVTGLRLTVTQVDDPFDKYPLVDVDQPTHSIIYINAVYAAREESE